MRPSPPSTGLRPTSPAAGLSQTSRRRFLRSAAIVGLGAPFVVGHGWAAASPNGKLNHACVGVGGMMGWGDFNSFLSHPRLNVAAICDVDANHLDRAAKAAPGARVYADWREMLEKEGDRIDSVNATVPDHTHFSVACSAALRGRHVYCQKPLCHDVAEVRALTEIAVRKGIVTQLGTQIAATIHDRTAVRWLREGRVGKVKHLYLCSNRPGAVESYRLVGPRPAAATPPPPQLNWDLWLGSAPKRAFAPDIYHPVKWRAWQDFGTGWSGDIGCHVFDPVWKGLGLTAPRKVVAEVQSSWKESAARRGDTWPQGDHITWTFPGSDRTAGSELTVEWFDGAYYPPEEIRRLYSPEMKDYPAECSMVVGTEGALLIPLGYPPQLLPEEKFKGVKRPDLPPRDHYHHFVDACLGGEKTESHFAQTGPMAEAILLGTVAIRLPGESLEWNAKALAFANHEPANALLRRHYREEWRLEGF